MTARKHGEIIDGEVTRKNHKGREYETVSPTSTQGKNDVIVTGSKNS